MAPKKKSPVCSAKTISTQTLLFYQVGMKMFIHVMVAEW